MTNGNNILKNLAKQLSKGGDEQSSPGRSRSQRVDFTDNPLFLATDVAVPSGFTAGSVPTAQMPGPSELHIDVDPPAGSSSPFLNRQRSYDSYYSSNSQAVYGSAPDSPISEITEVAGMPRSHPDHTRAIPTNVGMPIDVANLNVIGTPPPGYVTRRELPLERVLREANKLWVTPMMAGLPTFLDKWWKGLRAAKNRGKKNLKGIGAVVQGIKDKTLALDPQEIFTAQVAGYFLLFLLAALIVYLWYEQRNRNDNIVFNTDKFNLDPTKTISLVPKKKYIIDRSNHKKGEEPPQGSPKDTKPNDLFVPYQYPPSRSNYIKRR